jgi:hypothetical protein
MAIGLERRTDSCGVIDSTVQYDVATAEIRRWMQSAVRIDL